ncbi:MAG: hypothetical protein EBZ18_06790, partial [Alphaproteobacteria bacterium]|nr:hypothetical protein [Alphaproteobacteria bacterium]
SLIFKMDASEDGLAVIAVMTGAVLSAMTDPATGLWHDHVHLGNNADLMVVVVYGLLLPSAVLNTPRLGCINIHPSLLPRHKGLNTHEKAIQAGDRDHGCSVHLVTPGMDEGPVLGQRRVPVLAGDTTDTLAARVLAEEHRLYPLVVGAIAAGLLDMSSAKACLRDGEIKGRIEGLPFPLKWPAD